MPRKFEEVELNKDDHKWIDRGAKAVKRLTAAGVIVVSIGKAAVHYVPDIAKKVKDFI